MLYDPGEPARPVERRRERAEPPDVITIEAPAIYGTADVQAARPQVAVEARAVLEVRGVLELTAVAPVVEGRGSSEDRDAAALWALGFGL